jgi:hypothetical protein
VQKEDTRTRKQVSLLAFVLVSAHVTQEEERNHHEEGQIRETEHGKQQPGIVLINSLIKSIKILLSLL